jgi:hypothetical protein
VSKRTKSKTTSTLTGRPNSGEYRPQALFQDGSDLPLFTGYNPQPVESGNFALKTPANPKPRTDTPEVIDESPSLPVYRTTRVVEFYSNPPDQGLTLSGDPVAVVSGVLVSIVRSAPRGEGWYLVEHEGRYAWTCWVAAV